MSAMQTERLEIQPVTSDEFSFLENIDVHTREAMNGLYAMGEGPWYAYWKISLRDSGTHIGGLCFMGEPVNGSVEIGYGIFPEFQNQGFMTEAVNGVISFLKEKGVTKVCAESEKDNVPSHRVLKKCGFKISDVRDETLMFEKII